MSVMRRFDRQVRDADVFADIIRRSLVCRLGLTDGDQPYVVDVNPNPDINSESVVTMSAQSAGLTYTDLIARLADLAAERRPSAARPKAVRAQPRSASRVPIP